jgi:mono/diheme cytochrome c family protein
MRLQIVASVFAFLVVFTATAPSADKPAAKQPAAADEFPPQPPIQARSPEEELKTIQLPDGYRLELVLSEPDIKEPTAIAFDGNGRMYVVEMRTYMQDIDGTNEHQPVSRISRHESTKRDGRFDKHTAFLDNILLPRMVLPLDDRVLVGVTDSNDIHAYRDTNGDGVADAKMAFYEGGPRGGNMEHQPSGLLWAMDNWLYTTYNAYRLRWTGGTNALKESTAPNGGQWGLAQDDHGKPWWSNAGGEKGLWHFQTHVLYGAIDVRGQFPEDFLECYPLVGLADVQGGTRRFRPEDKTLNHFTASCGHEIFRGDRLPADLRGNAFLPEPVGRLIRRAKVEVRDGITYLSNPYPKSEFIRATDPYFRPINMATGPDGCLYIVDMYRGIIQEGNWTREGSYLRKVIKQYSMDKIVGRGRVWRLVHKDFQPGPQPKMLDETPAQWVAHLEHPNGWWRDTAQKLLVVRGDKSVVPALLAMTRNSPNHLARMHALWALEGLGAADASLVREKLGDANPRVRETAIRVSETLYKAGDKSLQPAVLALAKDSDPNVVLQVIGTSKVLAFTNWQQEAQVVVATSKSQGVQEIGKQLLATQQSIGGAEFTKDEIKVLQRGDAIYKELCFACHGFDGKGMPQQGAAPGLTMAPPLSGSRTITGAKDGPILVLLHGLGGPINRKTYEAHMVSMATNDDDWIAAVASFVRNSFGNRAGMVTKQDVARVRKATAGRTEPWTIETLRAALPQPIAVTKEWKVTASHNAATTANAIDHNPETRWDTKTVQAAGQWFQIELPEERTLSGLRLDAGKSRNDFPRGFKVELSADGKTWGKPVAEGKGTGAVTNIEFPLAKAKFIRITQTTTQKNGFWSIHELELLKPGELPVTKTASPKKPSQSFE